jgi:hypothetical protein
MILIFRRDYSALVSNAIKQSKDCDCYRFGQSGWHGIPYLLVSGSKTPQENIVIRKRLQPGAFPRGQAPADERM